MADLKISQLTELSQLTGQEMVPVQNGQKNNKVSMSTIMEYVSSNDTDSYKVNLGAIMTGSPASATVSDAIGDVSEILERINNEKA